MKNSFKIASVFIGTFVGAGFASGQEIMQYFVIYGKCGIVGAVVSSIIFTIFCYCTLYNAVVMGEDLYAREINRIPILKLIYYGFMYVIFCAMITASGELLKEVANVPKIYGAFGMALICALILLAGGEGVVKLNTLLTPLIFAGIIIVCFIQMYSGTVSTMAGVEFLESSVIYISYNMVTLASVVIGLGKFAVNKKVITLSSVISGGGILVLILCMFYVLFDLPYGNSEIPVLEVLSNNFKLIYTPVLVMAMVTTAVSNGYGFICRCKKHRLLIVYFLCVSGVIFSCFSFSFVVKYFYSLFGYIGIYVMFDNFKIFMKNKKNRENKRKIKNL